MAKIATKRPHRRCHGNVAEIAGEARAAIVWVVGMANKS